MTTAGAGSVDGDYYLVTGATIPGGIFKKVAGSWVNQNYSIIGPTGATGATGPQGPSGSSSYVSTAKWGLD
jgi:hypothetical protein